MSYSIKISGIHCNGCKNLIKLSLEDEGLENVEINDKSGEFESNSDINKVEEVLNKIFLELKKSNYSFSDLTCLPSGMELNSIF